MEYSFEGYVRGDGTAGTRNYIGIVCSVICSSIVAKEISERVPRSVPVIHGNGCAQLGDDFNVTKNMLVGVASNPNLYSALLVGLGCETNQISGLLDMIPKTKPVKGIGIQQLAGGKNAISEGIQIAETWSQEVEGKKRERLPLSFLTVGITTVDIDKHSLHETAPLIGKVVDLLVENGATVMMGITETLVPAAFSLVERAATEEAKGKLENLKTGVQRRRWKKTENEQPVASGFSEEEKSLAALEAAMTGTTAIKSLMDYNEKPQEKGLHLAKASNNVVETLSNFAAGGCNIALAVSSRGVLTGSVALPCMTITPPETDGFFEELVDYTVTSEDISIQADNVIREITEISSGKQTNLEQFELGEFSIPHVGTPF